jgi:hypothetical protein
MHVADRADAHPLRNRRGTRLARGKRAH